MAAHFTRVRAWTLCLGLAVVIIGGASCSGVGSASPGAGVTTGFLTYWDGSPGSGAFNPTVLFDPSQPTAPQFTGNRFFRFRATFRNDNIQNRSQQYDGLVVAITTGT